MTIDETNRLLATLKSMWPHQKILAATVNAWQMALCDVEYEAVMLATVQWMRTEKFFPVPAELRGLLVPAIDSAEEAWREVMRAIQYVGHYHAPGWSSVALANAVEAIGWRNLCLSEQIGIERAHFFRVYESYRSRAMRDATLGEIGADSYEGLAAKRRFEDAHEPLGDGDTDGIAGEDDD